MDTRLIVPVGACDQYGPHLPIGTGTLLADALARDLAREVGVLRAPAVPYGVNVPADRAFAGTAGLAPKTLHRVLNDLLADWEDHGITEFILISTHRHEPHVDAVATVTGTQSRVRVLDALSVDLSQFLDGPGGRAHGGEVETSLMLYLYPDRVNMERAQDFALPESHRQRLAPRPLCLPATSPGSLGHPTLADAEKGREIYHFLVDRIREKFFIHPDDDD